TTPPPARPACWRWRRCRCSPGWARRRTGGRTPSTPRSAGRCCGARACWWPARSSPSRPCGVPPRTAAAPSAGSTAVSPSPRWSPAPVPGRCGRTAAGPAERRGARPGAPHPVAARRTGATCCPMYETGGMSIHENLLGGPPPTHLPTSPLARARRAGEAFGRGGVAESYAYARTGYHRGLDALRRNGWKGHGPVPWEHEPNRGFLRALHALARAAQAIGEKEEYE